MNKAQLRKNIDNIDEEIAKLLIQRVSAARLAMRQKRIKKYDKKRETIILKRYATALREFKRKTEVHRLVRSILRLNPEYKK